MPVYCGCHIDGLWANNERSNAWAWIRSQGWRKLDDRSDDACTNLLAIAAMAKETGTAVSIHEETRGGRTFITEIVDFQTGALGPTDQVSFSISECIYGWTAAYDQRGTHITVRIRLNPDAGLPAATLASLQSTWRSGIESAWSNRFGCCDTPGCNCKCMLTFEVQWVVTSEHHVVRVVNGSGRSNMGTWFTNLGGSGAAHEFGHMVGHPDEYTDLACPGRTPVNTGTVMDNLGAVVARLCRPFCDRLGQSVD